jgi:hypothetical protein
MMIDVYTIKPKKKVKRIKNYIRQYISIFNLIK